MNDTLGLIALAILAQTAGLFFWGGKVQQILKDHERRLRDQEKATRTIERRIPQSGTT